VSFVEDVEQGFTEAENIVSHKAHLIGELSNNSAALQQFHTWLRIERVFLRKVLGWTAQAKVDREAQAKAIAAITPKLEQCDALVRMQLEYAEKGDIEKLVKTYKSEQELLESMKSIALLPQMTVATKLAGWKRSSFAAILLLLMPAFSMGGSTPPPLTPRIVKEAGCAEWVINYSARNSSALKQITTNLFGISGNAWTIMDNIQSRGGKIIFNEFATIATQYGTRIETLRTRMAKDLQDWEHEYEKAELYERLNKKYGATIQAMFPKRSHVDITQLQPGDIVGLYYQGSGNQAVAFMNGEGGVFNSHVGIVTEIKNGAPQIAHNIHSELKIDKASDLLTPQNSNHSMIVWVARPNAIARAIMPVQ
jgi:hypothetical protein